MAAQFVTLRQQGEADGMVAVGEYWYLTEDKSRVVREGDPAGRWLWASPGTEVPRADALRLGAIKSETPDPEPEPATEPEAEPVNEAAVEAEAEAVAEPEAVDDVPAPQPKARRKPADKSRKPDGDK